ncbi:MAG TPA: molybdopterin-dependent oxidoreductase [Candidatus Binatia bacterium]|nr:molybdopterin-dependent oxidoreductase [Candidatus Binatia bacterium]
MADEPDRSDAAARIVDARLRLRERFLERMRATPAVSDARPLGGGPPNRHGMPRIPIGQTPTAPGKWPVLDLGSHPDVPLDRWLLAVDGDCDRPLRLDWQAFLALEQVDDTSDFHCVTGWSRLDIPWRGVRVATVLALAEPRPSAAYLLCHAYDGYTTNVPLAEALKDDVLLVHSADGQPLPREHGGPVRMITPELYAWKGAKWISRLEILSEDRLGFWERNGYSNTAHPWRNDRYS